MSSEPDWEAVRGKRVCDMTEEQFRDAWELWIREQIGYMYSKEHVEFLLERLDEARGVQS